MLTNGYLILPQSLIFLWLIIILLYRYYYNRNINKVLSGQSGLKLIPLWKFSLISLILVLSVYTVLYTIKIRNTEQKKLYDASEFFTISFSAGTMEKLDEIAYNGIYSHTENSGYTKTEYTQNDFHYTVFRSQLFHDGMHPDMLVYIEYTGEDYDPYTVWSTFRFLDPDGEPITTYMQNGNPYPCFMFMLRYNADCTAEITLDYLKNKEDAEAAGDPDLKERDELLKEISLIHETFTLDLKHSG